MRTPRIGRIALPPRAASFAALLAAAGALAAAAPPETQLVSVNHAGTASGNQGSYGRGFSPDGRFVAFISYASDLLTDVTAGQNVYLRDLIAGTTTLVSVADSGVGGANGQCFNPVVSADGRYVAFESTATNLVPNDTNSGVQGGRRSDVFVRDLQLGVTTLVSVNLAGTDSGEDDSFLPSISADGSVVAFFSRAKTLVPNLLTSCSYHPIYEVNVFVRHMPFGPTELVSVSRQDRHGCGESYGYQPPALSADGRYVAFMSGAGDLAGNDGNSQMDVFVRDLVSHTTTLASVNLAGDTGSWITSNGSEYPFMSSDGRYVVFTSYSPNLVSNDSNGRRDVFVRDLVLQETRLVSQSATGDSGNGDSFALTISPNGRYVGFYSYATNIVDGLSDSNGVRDSFVRDIVNQATLPVSVDATGTRTANAESLVFALSSDGRIAAFESKASDLVAGDGNGQVDVYVRDLPGGRTSLGSVRAAGDVAGNDISAAPFLSADGRLLSFTSSATDLVELPDGNQGQTDVFVRALRASPEEAIGDLLDLLHGFGLPKGTDNSLSVKLEHALQSLAAGDPATACAQLGAFVAEVEAQRGKKLTVEQADQLLAGAQAVRSDLGCV